MKKLFLLFFLLSCAAIYGNAQATTTFSCNQNNGNALTTAGQFCQASAGTNLIPAGTDTHNVYIIPEGTPGTLTVLIQGSVIGDFTDAVTCGTSTVTTPNVLTCSGIYARIRVKLSTFVGFTSVNITYVGTTSVARRGAGVISGTGAPAGSCSAVPLYVDTSTGNVYSCNTGTWQLVSSGGSGNVTGPASSVDSDVTVFNGATGKIIKDSGFLYTNIAKVQTCTNKLLSVVDNAGTAGNCKTVTSAYTDTSIAQTGVDINTSFQVTALHLASPLPVLQGGTGLTAGVINQVLGGATPSYVTINKNYVDTTICSDTSCTQTAANVSGVVAIANGGTSNTTKAAAFLALAPSSTAPGDIIYCSHVTTGACDTWSIVAGNGSGTKFFQETSAGVPSWQTVTLLPPKQVQVDFDGSGLSGVLTANDNRNGEVINVSGNTWTISNVSCWGDTSDTLTVQFTNDSAVALLSPACTPGNAALTTCTVVGGVTITNGHWLNSTITVGGSTLHNAHCALVFTVS